MKTVRLRQIVSKVVALLPRCVVANIRARSFARDNFAPTSPSSQLQLPRRIPPYINQYSLYVGQLLEQELAKRKTRKTLYLCLPKHVPLLPPSSIRVMLQIEQTIFVDNVDELSTDGVSKLREDEGKFEVISGVRVHGPLDAYRKSTAVVDYSSMNLANLKRLPDISSSQSRMFLVAPLLPESPQNLSTRKKVNIATMYGSPHLGRRSQITESLGRNGITVKNLHNFYDYNEAFREVAILINFRQVEHFSTPEDLRILPALLQRVIVITEDTPYARASLCAEFLVFATAENLSSVAEEVSLNYKKFWDKIFGGKKFQAFTEELKADNRKSAQQIVALSFTPER
jgi:hypothetical protein